MTIKKLLGLDKANISDTEIIARLSEARKKNLGEVEFICPDGSRIKILLP